MKEIVNDKSNYTFEQRIVLRVWEHEQPQTRKTLNHSCESFQQRSGQKTFPKKTLLRLEHKHFATGNIKDKPGTGRPLTGGRHCGLVEEAVVTLPQKSTRKWSAELGMPPSKMQKHMKIGLKIAPVSPSVHSGANWRGFKPQTECKCKGDAGIQQHS